MRRLFRKTRKPKRSSTKHVNNAITAVQQKYLDCVKNYCEPKKTKKLRACSTDIGCKNKDLTECIMKIKYDPVYKEQQSKSKTHTYVDMDSQKKHSSHTYAEAINVMPNLPRTYPQIIYRRTGSSQSPGFYAAGPGKGKKPSSKKKTKTPIYAKVVPRNNRIQPVKKKSSVKEGNKKVQKLIKIFENKAQK